MARHIYIYIYIFLFVCNVVLRNVLRLILDLDQNPVEPERRGSVSTSRSAKLFQCLSSEAIQSATQV